jgi:hypothetical protein
LPAALPPESRPVGQVVAETIRLYSGRFWLSLPLGVPVAIASPLNFERSRSDQALVFLALAPLFTLAYIAACAIERGKLGSRRRWLFASGVGLVAMIPAAAMFSWFYVAAVVWLAIFGWVVPVAMNEERRSARGVARRALELFRSDVPHALGGLAALVVVFALTRWGMVWLLRSQAENTVRVSAFIADLVLSPVLFLGAAIVYRDLVARVGREPTPNL